MQMAGGPPCTPAALRHRDGAGKVAAEVVQGRIGVGTGQNQGWFGAGGEGSQQQWCIPRSYPLVPGPTHPLSLLGVTPAKWLALVQGDGLADKQLMGREAKKMFTASSRLPGHPPLSVGSTAREGLAGGKIGL